MISTGNIEAPVHIVVVGAGPAGTTFAMLLVHFFQEQNRRVNVTLYESRIIKDGAFYRWRNEKDVPRNRRRRQVITLQNSVLKLLPNIINEKINQSKNIEKNVWRDSLNIPIMEYEDLSLELIQKEPFMGMITIINSKFEPEFVNVATSTTCDLLVFADGSSSTAFNELGIHKCSFGYSDYALGVPYHVENAKDIDEATFLQNLNVALTVGQTRYLMNSLRSERGYLNIRLNSNEFGLLKQGDTLDDIKQRAVNNEELQVVQRIILDGLAMFGIDKNETQPIDKFEIQMHYASCRYYQSGNFARVPTCLIGNAALSVHFWPGRGANSGLKSAYALAFEVQRCSASVSRPYFLANSSSSLINFESYMAELIIREQCGRSGIISEVQLPKTNEIHEVFAAERNGLTSRILGIAKDLRLNLITENEILKRLQDVSKPSIYTMYHSGRWPAMGSFESDPRKYLNILSTTRAFTKKKLIQSVGQNVKCELSKDVKNAEAAMDSLKMNSDSSNKESELEKIVSLTRSKSSSQLELSNKNLSGIIPLTIRNLITLTILRLDGNQLSGIIPPELGQLYNLKHLDLNNNQLTGTIPTEIGHLTKLQYFSMYNNACSGSIPSSLGKLTNLTVLCLSNNKLNGTIPPELGNLKRLTYFSLYCNDLVGQIPSELGQLTSLECLLLHTNQLDGFLPSILGGLTQLTELFLNDNQFSGYIPSKLQNLTRLTKLGLHRNKLIGSIPSELGYLKNLKSLGLHHNQLTGSIPSELGYLTNLNKLGLENNNLSGRIPSEIAYLENLTQLNLYNNPNLDTQNIPSSIRAMKNFGIFRINS
ncbi:hypothetical protein BC833DRAFT_646168 [Globomyces pollinis-pini]|nr:hypothetical protein BC833DRAFT_646168 [Globomyces pollinis-pini]